MYPTYNTKFEDTTENCKCTVDTITLSFQSQDQVIYIQGKRKNSLQKLVTSGGFLTLFMRSVGIPSAPCFFPANRICTLIVKLKFSALFLVLNSISEYSDYFMGFSVPVSVNPFYFSSFICFVIKFFSMCDICMCVHMCGCI